MSAGRVEVTPSAKRDLDAIWDYVALDNIDAADDLIDRFDELFAMLGQYPSAGRARDSLSPGLRSFPLGDYLVFYRITEHGIAVVSVVHGYRDLEALF